MRTESVALEYIAGKSDKFWNAILEGTKVTVKYGRRGTFGQEQEKVFPNEGAAFDYYRTKVNEKLMKGYVDTHGTPTPPPPPSDAAMTKLAKGLAKIEAALRPDELQPEDFATPAIKQANATLNKVAPALEASLQATLQRIGVPEVRPMLAEEVRADTLPTYIADDRFVLQQKLDGARLMVHSTGGKLMVLGRAGQSSQYQPMFTRAPHADLLSLGDCVVDGELIGQTLWLFDLPSHPAGGIDLATPYGDRLAALQGLMGAWNPDPAAFRLLRTAETFTEKAELALECLKKGAEGVMIKDVNAKYEAGVRVNTVLKAKFVRDADFVITAVGSDGKSNYSLSLFKDGVLTEVGRCSSIGKTPCDVGDVATVRFLYVGAQGQLYQPRFICKRDDKDADECVYDQIADAHVNKEVLV